MSAMSMSVSQTSDYSSAAGDWPMSSQDLDVKDVMLTPKQEVTEEVTPESRPVLPKVVSKCSVKSEHRPRLQNWNGSQVVNYKTFKKCSHNSQSSQSSQPIPLRTVENELSQKRSENMTDEERIGDTAPDSENSNKRKLDYKEAEELDEELGLNKKPRISSDF